MSLILASGSPRRQELLRLITPDFTVRVSGAEEHVQPGLTPAETVEMLARVKGEAVFREYPEETVLSADTVVELGGVLLGKPASPEAAAEMLRALSGKTHRVFTGVCILAPGKRSLFHDCTEVTFYPLSEAEIAAYVATGEPFDKAGAYGIQGRGALLVEGIKGDYYNVMGFPVAKVARELRRFGI